MIQFEEGQEEDQEEVEEVDQEEDQEEVEDISFGSFSEEELLSIRLGISSFSEDE